MALQEAAANHQSQTLKQHNYGIDLLRIIAALYVLTLHSFGIGGILNNVPEGTLAFCVVYFFEILAYCAVDVFALISGYTSVSDREKEHDWSKIIVLWLEVVFYNELIMIIYQLINNQTITFKMIIEGLTPVANTSNYWYFSAYLCLFIMMPLLDKGIRNTDEKHLKTIMIICILLFSVYSVFLPDNQSFRNERRLRTYMAHHSLCDRSFLEKM